LRRANFHTQYTLEPNTTKQNKTKQNKTKQNKNLIDISQGCPYGAQNVRTSEVIVTAYPLFLPCQHSWSIYDGYVPKNTGCYLREGRKKGEKEEGSEEGRRRSEEGIRETWKVGKNRRK
jgi:hypothetical protein